MLSNVDELPNEKAIFQEDKLLTHPPHHHKATFQDLRALGITSAKKIKHLRMTV